MFLKRLVLACAITQILAPGRPRKKPRRPNPDVGSVGESEEYSSSTTVLPTTAVTTAPPVAALLPWVPGTIIQVFRYKYNDKFLEKLDSRTREWAVEQMQKDADNLDYTPLLDYDYELVTGCRLGKLINRQSESVVYGIEGKPNLVIKYQSNCFDQDDIHPLLRDFWMLDFLEDTGIVPYVDFVSPPTQLVARRTPKTDFYMDQGNREECIAAGPAVVRFMTMQRLGASIYDIEMTRHISGHAVPLQDAISIMIRNLKLVQALHSKGIVHGDIHPGNVVYVDGTRSSLMLIDFGLAFFAADKIETPDRVRAPMSYIHCLYSPYDLDGYRFAYRNDAFNAVMMGSLIINGPAFKSHCYGLEQLPTQMMKFKKEEFLFVIPGEKDRFDSLQGKTVEQKAQIRNHLARVLHLVRTVEDINALPPYEEIFAELKGALKLVVESE